MSRTKALLAAGGDAMSRWHPAAGRRYQQLCTGCLAAFRERFAPRYVCPRCGDAGVALLPGNLPPAGPERAALAARARRPSTDACAGAT